MSSTARTPSATDSQASRALERVLERELADAPGTCAGDAPQATVRSAPSAGITEVRTVRQIEEVHSEVDGVALTDLEPLPERDVHVNQARPLQVVAA